MAEIKMPKMSPSEIKLLVETQFLCRMAFKGGSHPYIAPFQYVTVDGTLYFHFTDYGKKMGYFKQETPVCVEIEHYTFDLSDYGFVVLTGKLVLVVEPKERKTAIRQMGQAGKAKLSQNFLVAHGFPEGSNWDVFTEDKPILIMKLKEEAERVGLKSP